MYSMTRTRTRIWTAAGVAVGLVGGAGAGMVLGVPGLSSAATAPVVEQVDDQAPPADEPVPDTDQAPPADETDAPETDDAPRPDRTTRIREMLDDLVADGTISSEQADAVAGHLAENAPQRGDRDGRRGKGHRGGGAAVAEVIGIDVETLRTELKAGSSLADIATANGVDPQTVVDALVAKATERIDAAVDTGKIDQAKADEKLAELDEKITARVNGEGRSGN
jgi:hypothetical protein